MESLKDLVNIRQVELCDLPFIVNSSVSCLSHYTESIVKGFEANYAKQLLEKIVLHTLNDPAYSTYVCSHKDDENSIIAYIIANPHNNHIFFQYTKYAYRKLGVQKFFLLPLLVDDSSKITVQWPTKEMLKLQKLGKIHIENKLLQELLEEVHVNRRHI